MHVNCHSYSALFFDGSYESRNVGIKLFFRYQQSYFGYITWYHPRRGGRGWRCPGQESIVSPLTSKHWTQKKTLAYDIGNYGMEQAHKCGRIKPVNGISTDICHDYFSQISSVENFFQISSSFFFLAHLVQSTMWAIVIFASVDHSSWS
jgi:hypothetical protein